MKLFGFLSLRRPTIAKPWWLNLLLGKRPRLRMPTLSAFYRWKK